ncbi:MAG: phosphatase PAP2 family protein [Bdellovibrionales bacterium]|nr:phosphatase PAP2 family protein [Bdellovibrionales bacterium]
MKKFVGVALVLFSSSAYAFELSDLFSFRNIDFSSIQKLIGLPPGMGSAESNQDFQELLYWQGQRTQAQCDFAKKEVNLILRNFIGNRTDLLSPREEIKLTKDLSILQVKVMEQVNGLKKIFGRPRPYQVEKRLKPCVPLENSLAYPSAHSAISYAFAQSLSSVFPDRSQRLFDRAQEIAFNRMMGGVHHRSDLAAGEKVGRFFGRLTRVHLE